MYRLGWRLFGHLGMVVGLGLINSAQCTLPTLTAERLPGNFHVIDEGRAYRSAQPDADELAALIDAYGIRTVLNLRGNNAGKLWYDDEARVCAEKGITLANFSLSAKSLPDPEDLKGVVQVLKTGPYPMLIHCSGGADRTGMITAIYNMLILGQDRPAALSALSSDYLHFRPIAPCMDTLAELYEPTDAWLDWYAAHRDSIECR